MKPAVLSPKGPRAREALLLLLLLAAAAVASALLFDAATHPERLHDPVHHRAFARDREALPALGALRVRSALPLHVFAGLGRAHGITPEASGLIRRSRYLRAGGGAIDDALAALDRGEVPVPPPAPDLVRYYRDADGPYLCDLVLAPGKTTGDVLARDPAARLSGEPVLREAEARGAAPLARALLLGLALLGGWTAWRRGRREAGIRLLAALLVLVATGLLRTGLDVRSVAALLLVVGAPRAAPLLAAAPCMLFPIPALERLGLVLALGGALRLLLDRPPLPPRPPRVLPVAALALALAGLAYAALGLVPPRVTPRPEVAAEPSALLVAKADVDAAAARLRAAGLEVTGDERLLPRPPDLATRRDLWRLFTRARTLARAAEGERRAALEEVADAASQMSLTTLPRDLRARLLARDGRAVLWAPAGTEGDDLASARLYRARGERELRERSRLAGVLVAAAGLLALAVARGGARAVLLRFAGMVAGAALLLLSDPGGADPWIPLLPLAAAAAAPGAWVALGAAALVHPGLAWPAAALLLAALPASLYGPRRQRPPPA